MSGDYPDNWPQIAAGVKAAAGNACEHCGHAHDPESGHTLTVHHLDGNKANCDRSNLVAHCQRCHLHWQARWHPAQSVFEFAVTEWMKRRGLG